MMTVEKMAKVVSKINRGLASSRPQGVEDASHVHTNSDPTCLFRTVIALTPMQLDANIDIRAAAI